MLGYISYIYYNPLVLLYMNDLVASWVKYCKIFKWLMLLIEPIYKGSRWRILYEVTWCMHTLVSEEY